MRTLSQIVRGFDVVAVQELKDRTRKVPFAFLDEINKAGDDYRMLLSERSGRQDNDKWFREFYAYYYRTSTIAPLDDGVLYDDSESDDFQREPFVARFRTRSGTFSFVLITVHTQPDAAVPEIAALHKVVEWVSAPFRKCTKTAVVEVLVTSWHLLRYLFDSLSSSPPDGLGLALYPPCARHFQTDRSPTISRWR